MSIKILRPLYMHIQTGLQKQGSIINFKVLYLTHLWDSKVMIIKLKNYIPVSCESDVTTFVKIKL